MRLATSYDSGDDLRGLTSIPTPRGSHISTRDLTSIPCNCPGNLGTIYIVVTGVLALSDLSIQGGDTQAITVGRSATVVKVLTH